MQIKKSLILAAAFAAAAIQAQPLTNGVALAYFAPENQMFYRMRTGDGGYREFQRDLTYPSVMLGARQWMAFVDQDEVAVRGPAPGGEYERFIFKHGRLVRHEHPAGVETFAFDVPRIPPANASAPFLFGSIREKMNHRKSVAKMPKSARDLIRGKWKYSGRLAWPFENPNESGCLFASLALLSLYLTCFRRRWLTIAGIGLFTAFAIPLLLTQSRGNMLGLFVGLIPVGIVHFRTLVRSRWTYVAMGLLAVAATAWFSIKGFGIITRGSVGESSWSNEVRLNMWGMAPRMMVDAPGGWNANAGKAYLDWYEDFDCFTAPGSLINDHLSIMVQLGWTKRFIYVFCWMLVLFGLFFQGLKTKNQIPTAVISAGAVACWFNPTMVNKWLWIVPLLAPVTAVIDRPWRYWRRWLLASGCAFATAALALLLAYELGTHKQHPYGVRIAAQHDSVTVNGANPQVWIVDDGETLGGAFACKELRSWFAGNPHSPSVGYTQSCAYLPRKQFRKLVLGGEIADEWLRYISSSAEARKQLPQEVVFISPPFPPSAIPPALFNFVRVKYVTGEFNARYCRELDNPPPFVEIVPAMELYLPNWMRYAQ